MNTVRRFLLGLLALGLPGAAAVAQEAAAMPPAPVAVAPVVPGMAEVLEGTAGPVSGRAGVVAGVGLYLVQPYFENNPAYNVLSETHVQTGPTTSDTVAETVGRVNVSHHMQAAPLVWLGYMGESGLGARARYWYFRQGSDQQIELAPFTGDFIVQGTNVIQLSGTLYTATSAAPQGLQAFGDTLSRDLGREGAIFNVQTKLEAQVADLEICQDFRPGRWDILLSAGIRIVRLVQTYNVYDKQTSGPLEFRSLLSSHDFTGAGPVVAAELRRRLGASDLHFVASGRGAYVMGSAQQDATFSGLRLRNEDPNPQFATQHWNRGLPIAELEVGLEYARDIGPGQAFAQVNLVGQQWFDAGNASRSTNLTVPFSPRPAIGGAPADSNLAFFGVGFRLGWNY